MTPLEKELHSLIETEGPLSIADYMTLCLTHPQHGYYTTGLPIGGLRERSEKGGDFITAPEVSQMFGELIGVWCMQMWVALDRPSPFNLIEIGPGRGTLMRDMLRSARTMPGFLDAAEVFLIEISPGLQRQQAQTLSDQRVHINWLRGIDQLPEQPSLIVANELLDALPFRQWVKREDQWLERAVGLGDNALAYTLRPNKLHSADLPEGHKNASEGSLFETSPAREGYIERTADLLLAQSGAALFIDYGHLTQPLGDTFQAMRNHAFVDPLEAPGEVDLTSHVDFSALAAVVKSTGCPTTTPTTQGRFLLNLGLLQRAGALGAGHDHTMQQNLRDAVERLAGPEQMGELFKALAFGASPTINLPWPGFD